MQDRAAAAVAAHLILGIALAEHVLVRAIAELVVLGIEGPCVHAITGLPCRSTSTIGPQIRRPFTFAG